MMSVCPVTFSASTDVGCGGFKQPATKKDESLDSTLNNPPFPITPPSRHHLYIIHLINVLHCFYPLVSHIAYTHPLGSVDVPFVGYDF